MCLLCVYLNENISNNKMLDSIKLMSLTTYTIILYGLNHLTSICDFSPTKKNLNNSHKIQTGSGKTQYSNNSHKIPIRSGKTHRITTDIFNISCTGMVLLKYKNVSCILIFEQYQLGPTDFQSHIIL